MLSEKLLNELLIIKQKYIDGKISSMYSTYCGTLNTEDLEEINTIFEGTIIAYKYSKQDKELHLFIGDDYDIYFDDDD